MTPTVCINSLAPTIPFEAPYQLDDIPGRFDLCIPLPEGNMPDISLLVDTINRRATVIMEIDPAFRAVRKFADGTASYEPKPSLPPRVMQRTFAAIANGMQPTGHWIDRECIIFRGDRAFFNVPLPFAETPALTEISATALLSYSDIFRELERFGWIVAAHTELDVTDIRKVFDLPDEPRTLTRYNAWDTFLSEVPEATPEAKSLWFAGFPRPLEVVKICEPEYHDELAKDTDTVYTYHIIKGTRDTKRWLCCLNLGFDIVKIVEAGTFDPVLLDQRLPKFMKAYENGTNGFFNRINLIRHNDTSIILRYDFPASLSPDREEKVIADMKQYALDIRKEFVRFANYLKYKANDKSDRNAERFTSIITTTGIMHILSAALGG